MPAIRTLALVVRTVEVFETSLVATLFTRELGKVAVLAKGARRLKSPFQGGLDLLGVSDIVMFPKASEALDLLAEAAPVERFASLRRDLAALYAGYYIAELLTDLTDLHDPHPKLFDAARITLRHLGDAELRSRRVMRFELACLRELGLMPALDRCAQCGAAVEPHGESGVVRAGCGRGALCTPAGPASRTSRRSRSRTWRRSASWPARAVPGASWTLDPASSGAGSRDGRGGHQSRPGPSSPAPALTGSVTRWFGLTETSGSQPSVASRRPGRRYHSIAGDRPARRSRPRGSPGRAWRWSLAPVSSPAARASAARSRSGGRPTTAIWSGARPRKRWPMRQARPIRRTCSIAGSRRGMSPRTQVGRLVVLDPDPRVRRLAARWPSPPKDPKADAEFQAALKLFQQGKFAEAEKEFAKIAKNRKGTPWGENAQYYLAETQYQRKKYVDAHDSFEKLARRLPGHRIPRQAGQPRVRHRPALDAPRRPQGTQGEADPWYGRFDGSLPFIDTKGTPSRPSSTSARTTRPARWPTTPRSRSPNTT